MREILFRGKRGSEWIVSHTIVDASSEIFLPTGEWVDGDYNDEHGLHWLKSKSGKPFLVGVDPKTVGQYTGLSDKNGTMIFEGDIVKRPDVVHDGSVQIAGRKYEIKMQAGCWVIRNKFDWDFLKTNCDCEVIGNIHDNPELTEETK